MPSNPTYRTNFIRAYPGVRIRGYPGYWYKCAYCGKMCARPGNDKVKIPDYFKMEVDHIKPWSQGGSDELWNLQPLCKPCNRAKSNKNLLLDSRRRNINTIMHPVDAVKGVGRKLFRQSKILKALGLNKRK